MKPRVTWSRGKWELREAPGEAVMASARNIRGLQAYAEAYPENDERVKRLFTAPQFPPSVLFKTFFSAIRPLLRK